MSLDLVNLNRYFDWGNVKKKPLRHTDSRRCRDLGLSCWMLCTPGQAAGDTRRGRGRGRHRYTWRPHHLHGAESKNQDKLTQIKRKRNFNKDDEIPAISLTLSCVCDVIRPTDKTRAFWACAVGRCRWGRCGLTRTRSSAHYIFTPLYKIFFNIYIYENLFIYNNNNVWIWR